MTRLDTPKGLGFVAFSAYHAPAAADAVASLWRAESPITRARWEDVAAAVDRASRAAMTAAIMAQAERYAGEGRVTTSVALGRAVSIIEEVRHGR